MVRSEKEKSQSNNGKKPTKSSDCENEYMTTSESDSPTTETGRDSVHQQNLYIVSFPIIILFNILRSILYQIFIIFKYIFNVSSHYMPLRKRHTTNNIQVCVNHSAEKVQELNSQVNDGIGMTSSRPSHHQISGPGPADPLLAKQKHHHRRAFEYISKALKIDEENEGLYARAILCMCV